MNRRGVALVVALLAVFSVVGAGLENTFGEASLGYTIDYPSGWVVERVSEYHVRFTGASGTTASAVRFGIQNVASTAIGGLYKTVDELLDALKCQLVRETSDICIYAGAPITVVDATGRRHRYRYVC